MPKLCKRGRKRQTFDISGSERMKQNRSSETDTERTLRLQQMRDKKLLRLRVLTPKSKGKRLQEQRERKRMRLKKETPTKRKARLRSMIERENSWVKAETSEKRVARCLDLSERQASRLAEETETVRSARLQHKREQQASRLAAETDTVCDARLQNLRERQASRLAAETDTVRDARLQDMRERKASLEASLTGEQNLARKRHRDKLYSDRLTSRITLNFARSKIACDVSDSNIDEYSCGSFTYSWSICLAKFWEGEKLSCSTKLCLKFSLCCENGKVLSSVASCPELLNHLLTASDKRGKDFREKIRAYNCALAFASLGANIDKGLANAKQGVYTFRIHGVVYHCIGQLLPKDNEAPKYAQIYIHDGTADAEVENRLHHLEDASLPELRLLQLMMHEVNPYVSFFRQGIEVMRKQGHNDVRMIIRSEGTPDSRRYNKPTAPEVTVIMPGVGYGEEAASRDIVLHARSGGLSRITEIHRAYDALHYVILFPLGEDGWH